MTYSRLDLCNLAFICLFCETDIILNVIKKRYNKALTYLIIIYNLTSPVASLSISTSRCQTVSKREERFRDESRNLHFASRKSAEEKLFLGQRRPLSSIGRDGDGAARDTAQHSGALGRRPSSPSAMSGKRGGMREEVFRTARES